MSLKKFVVGAVMALGLMAPQGALAGNVGFQQVEIPNGGDKPLVGGVWYPTLAAPNLSALSTFRQNVATNAPVAGENLPIVIMSHGTGGWYGSHYDTALALAEAGFVVIAISHTGDTYQDSSRAARVQDRPVHLKLALDYVLKAWSGRGSVSEKRVGAFGFSAGGFTVLVASGGVPDLGKMADHVRQHPGYFDSQVMKRAGASAETMDVLSPSAWAHDARIRAAVVAAPALGFTFGKEGLKGVTIPIQLWRAADDTILPNPDYAQAVSESLPTGPEYHVIDNADHFDFLAPCDDTLKRFAPQICASRPGFDRTAFHQAFNREVVRFFLAKLS